MRRIWLILLALITVSAFTALGLTWSSVYNWPDFLHVDYGFPLAWATHTLNTIAGPVDKWSVDVSRLLIDLLFWDFLMVVAVVFATRLKD